MKRKINGIIIHCAATPNGKPFTAADINRMHKARKFKRDSQAVRNYNPDLGSIGYHFIIGVDGSIETGRHPEEVGAHVQGSNAKSLGICMIGTDKFTKEQWESLRTCLTNLASIIQGKPHDTHITALLAYKDMGISIKGHRDYSPDLNGNGIIERTEWIKICPGFDVSKWIKGGMMPMEGHIL